MGRRKAGRGRGRGGCGGGLRRCKDAEEIRGKKIVESESRILVHTFRNDGSRKSYGDLYTIDLEKDQVKECPHPIYRDLGISSVAALGSIIYMFAGYNPDLLRLYSTPEDEELRKNPNLHCYAGSSCLDLNDDSGWKPVPPLKFNPIDKCLGNLISLCGKIYAIGYNYAEVFDPQCNDWNLLLPPPGFENFSSVFLRPVVGDPSNKRFFLRFHIDNKKFPLYAYYPDDADNSGTGGRWELLVENFVLWPFGGVAVADGVLYIYIEKTEDVIGGAFDVETKQWLNIDFSSKFDLEIVMNRFNVFFHLGNGILCLANHYSTYVEVVKFRVRRNSSQNVLITPISSTLHTMPTPCVVSGVIPLI